MGSEVDHFIERIVFQAISKTLLFDKIKILVEWKWMEDIFSAVILLMFETS